MANGDRQNVLGTQDHDLRLEGTLKVIKVMSSAMRSDEARTFGFVTFFHSIKQVIINKETNNPQRNQPIHPQLIRKSVQLAQ